MSDLNVLVPLRTFRGSRNGYSWLNSDERKGKSSQAFISPSISKKFSPNSAAPHLSRVSQAFVEKKLSSRKRIFFYQDGRSISKKRGLVMKFRALDEKKRKEKREKNRNASKRVHLFFLYFLLLSHPRFPFFNVISQASDPAGFRFPFLFRALVSPSLAVTASIYRKSIPRPMFPFRFSICPVQRTGILLREHGTTKTEHLQEETLSLSLFLSRRKTIFPRSNSS